MPTTGLIRQPTALLPLAMSMAALVTVGWFLATYGAVRQPDEDAAVHLWQLLVAGQVPFVAWFAARWLPVSPRPALAVLALQAGAVAVAIAPLALLGGL